MSHYFRSVRIDRDGSNTGFLFVDQLAWEQGKRRLFKQRPSILAIGAKQAGTIGKMLRGRLLKDKELRLVDQDLSVTFKRSNQTAMEVVEDAVYLKLDEAAVSELAQKLQPKAGKIQLTSFKDICIQIVQTPIKDQEGNVVSIVG